MAINKRKYILGALIAILTLGICPNFTNLAFADDSSDEKPIHLQISPVKQKLKLERGQSYVSSFKVMNIGTESFTYKVSVSPYSVIDEKYNADYENLANNYTKMANWITFDKDTVTGTLEPKSSVDVPFTVTVPSDVPSGGQYAAITAETSDGNNPNSAIQTVNRLAMVLYADISGNTRTSGSIVNNTVPSFVFTPPLSVTSLVENTGNVETNANYTVKVWPLGSNETVFSTEEEKIELDIIPDTRRFNTITWQAAPHLGIFTVEQTIDYLGQTSTVKKLVIICPLWLILLIGLVVAFLIFWLVYNITKRRKAKNNSPRSNEQENRSN